MPNKNNQFELPDEPDIPGIKTVRDQLAALPEVERTKILTSLYGVALTSPPPETTYHIAVNTTNNSAYVVHFSMKNGWEKLQEVPPSKYWDQHTLETVAE